MSPLKMAAPQVIEGEFNGFDIRIAVEEDFEVLNQHLSDNFFRDEPLNKTVGFSEGFVADFAKVWRPLIQQRLSIIAFDKATKKVAGCRISLEQRKGHKYPETTIESTEAQKVTTILASINGAVDVYEKYGINRYAEFCLVSVDREFRQRGLAMELYNRSLMLLKANGFTHIKCAFSSPFSRRNGEKLGFVELVRKRFVDFVDENEQQILPNAAPDDMFTLNVLTL